MWPFLEHPLCCCSEAISCATAAPDRPTKPDSFTAVTKNPRQWHAGFAEAGTANDRAMHIRLGATTALIHGTQPGSFGSLTGHCAGGSTFSHPNQVIRGTDDPALFQEGREGKFQCRIPLPQGSHQLPAAVCRHFRRQRGSATGRLLNQQCRDGGTRCGGRSRRR